MKQTLLGLALMTFSLHAADQPQISTLTIEVANAVTYVGDVTDNSKLALIGSATTPGVTRAFTDSITVADVVKVNGKPAKGLWSTRSYAMGFSPAAAPGFAIADTQNGLGDCRWEIQTADGLLVGRFMEGGYGPHQITAGSGAFFGLQGQQTAVQTVVAPRRASMTEDPSIRRILGGGSMIHTFHVAPLYPPALTSRSDATPVLFHSDFTPVTAASPAHPGESVVVQALNLGFVVPNVNPGVAFTDSPYSIIAAPVDVVLAGQAIDTFNQIGWPGLVNTYRVDFVVPAGTAAGNVDLQLRVSGIAGPSVKIPVK